MAAAATWHGLQLQSQLPESFLRRKRPLHVSQSNSAQSRAQCWQNTRNGVVKALDGRVSQQRCNSKEPSFYLMLSTGFRNCSLMGWPCGSKIREFCKLSEGLGWTCTALIHPTAITTM